MTSPASQEVSNNMDQSHQTQWSYAAFSSETLVNQFIGGTSVLCGIVTQ